MNFFFEFFVEMGAMGKFLHELFRTFLQCRKKIKSLINIQITLVAYRSMGTILFSGFFVGAILVMQFYLMLSKYEATSLLGGLATSATMREIGPLIISFLLAGKIGAFTTAEIGTMTVTEQIDAIRCLGTDPIEYLIIPRFIAIIVCSTLLLFFGLLVGLVGSIMIADVLYNINILQFLESIPKFAGFWSLFGGVCKSIIYGTIVALVSTYKGYTATGGAKGVGIAVTQCAIYTNLLITLANSFSSFFLNFMQSAWNLIFGGFGN